MPAWSDFSPRTVGGLQPVGNGKTAVRVGYNKFMTAQTTGFAQLYNPTALTTQHLPWTDVNGDDIAQGERGCAVIRRAGCEINFAGLPANFGVRSLAQFDPDLKRPYQLRVQPRRHARSADRRDADGRVVPQRLQRHHRAPQLAAHRGSYDQFTSSARSTAASITVWLPKPGVASQVAERRQHQRRHEARLQRLRAGLQRARCAAASARSAASTSSARSTTCASRRPPIRTASLYCDQADSGIPWQKQFKATVVYPLPW